MTKENRLAAILVACAVMASPGAASADETKRNAENIRKLDIMLMVTSLRCRHGADDFRAEYHAFSARHIQTLNRAGRALQADLAHRHGARGAKKALDRISVGMANTYGNGHPWLGCSELRKVTRDLAVVNGPRDLSVAADELLAEYPADHGYARNDVAVDYDTRW